MSKLELDTDEKSLREVLSNGKRYCVPRFQRDYSWEREQWEYLWDDIMMLTGGEEKYHYMGYLVIQPDDKQPSKIIDGQQRLATFSFIVLAAIKRLREMGGENERIEELLKNFIGTKDLENLRVENKLKLNRNNDYYYRQVVEGKQLFSRGQKKTIQLMQRAIDYFHEKFKAIPAGQEIGKLLQHMSENIFFTTIYIGSDLHAYKVFETLNARGVQLSAGDVLKNYIFSRIDDGGGTPNEVLDELDEQWGTIGSTIGNQDYTHYVLTEWNSRNKLLRKGSLFKEISGTVHDKKSAKQYFDNLEARSNYYAALLNPDDEFWKDNPHYKDIQKNLRFLKLFSIRQPLSFLMAGYINMKPHFPTILNWIKIFSLRYNVVCGKYTGNQESLYNRLCLAIKENCSIHEIKEELLTLYPGDDEFTQAFTDKVMPTERSNRKARYIIACMEETMSNSGGLPIDDSTLTVEHILPLRPSDEWDSEAIISRQRRMAEIAVNTWKI